MCLINCSYIEERGQLCSAQRQSQLSVGTPGVLWVQGCRDFEAGSITQSSVFSGNNRGFERGALEKPCLQYTGAQKHNYFSSVCKINSVSLSFSENIDVTQKSTESQ